MRNELVLLAGSVASRAAECAPKWTRGWQQGGGEGEGGPDFASFYIPVTSSHPARSPSAPPLSPHPPLPPISSSHAATARTEALERALALFRNRLLPPVCFCPEASGNKFWTEISFSSTSLLADPCRDGRPSCCPPCACCGTSRPSWSPALAPPPPGRPTHWNRERLRWTGCWARPLRQAHHGLAEARCAKR